MSTVWILDDLSLSYHSEAVCVLKLVEPNFPKFPFLALYRLIWDGVVFGPAQVSALFAPTGRIHFGLCIALAFF